jgi:hypothetical protein
MAKAPVRIEKQSAHATTAEEKAATIPGKHARAAHHEGTPLPDPSKAESFCHSKPLPMPPLKNDRTPFKNLKG